MNKKWHEANPMPANATRDQRIGWHAAHLQACQCRPVPARLHEDVQRHLADHPKAGRKSDSPSG
jgi:hypothetical protein